MAHVRRDVTRDLARRRDTARKRDELRQPSQAREFSPSQSATAMAVKTVDAETRALIDAAIQKRKSAIGGKQ